MRVSIFGLICLLILGHLGIADTGYKKEELYTYRQVKTYTGKDLQTIAFPIGGLGTGNINLGGRGDIRELEIFNRPSKGVHPDMTFFFYLDPGRRKEIRLKDFGTQTDSSLCGLDGLSQKPVGRCIPVR